MSTSTRSTRMTAIDKGIRVAKQYKQCLEDITNEGDSSRPLNTAEKKGVKEFLSVVDDVKKTSKGSIELVKSWKRVQASSSKGGGKGGGKTSKRRHDQPDKPRKRGKREEVQEDKGEDADDDEDKEDGSLKVSFANVCGHALTRIKIGAPDMAERLGAARTGPPLPIPAWFQAISRASARNMWIDAAQGLLTVASGIEGGSDDDMTFALVDVLADNLERQVLDTLLNKSIDDIEPSDLHLYFKVGVFSSGVLELTTAQESRDKTGPLNKLSRVALLQHIVSSINTLKCALAWEQLEDGDQENDKITVVQQMYEAKCDEEETVADFESPSFVSFHKSVKTYHTGCNRFVNAYLELGSILFLCPRLRLARFADTRMGPSLVGATKLLELSAEEFAAREAVHHQILEYTIIILEGGIPFESDSGGSKLLQGLKDINQQMKRAVSE
ncbi:unnamed protein product [Rhizoctonia solani]|uniref:Uncharacterized protein n=1 Tax=Rhizoctonia solani TaxID=456999 RepID=A0A8H3EGL4_9AGAM|nr:unnamed protein product [Rhizoctonia solani]